MNVLTKWLRSYLPALPVDDSQLAEALTLRGIAVEGIYNLGEGKGSLYEMDITTNRVDAMNHYGVAREGSRHLRPCTQAARCGPARRAAGKDALLRAHRSRRRLRRFTARVLRGVAIANSRDWFPGAEISTYFGLLEQKCISNAVDATNFAGSPWASPPTPSTSTKSKAASSCAAPKKVRNSRPRRRGAHARS